MPRERHPPLPNHDLVLITHLVRIGVSVASQCLIHDAQWIISHSHDATFVHGNPFARIFSEQFVAHGPVIQAVLLEPLLNNLFFVTRHEVKNTPYPVFSYLATGLKVQSHRVGPRRGAENTSKLRVFTH